MNLASEFRDLVHSKDITVMVGAYDAYSAILAEKAGFDAVSLAGYIVGASTGITEPIINAAEMADRGQEISHQINIPVDGDAGAGFGNPPHVYRSTQHWAKKGIATFRIEDVVYPKRMHYHAGEVHLINSDQMIEKIKAAIRAREDMEEDVFIWARSDKARRQRREYEGETIEDAVNAINRYLDAGAEAGQVYPRNLEELEYAVDNVDGPLVYQNHTSYNPRITIDELEELGVSVTGFPHNPLVAAHEAIKDELAAILEQGDSPFDGSHYGEIQSEIEENIGLPKYYEISEEAGLRQSDELIHEKNLDNQGT